KPDTHAAANLQFHRQCRLQSRHHETAAPVRVDQRSEAVTARPDISAMTPTTIENADITVVGGAGHVGIPLVLALAESGLRVNVNDLNQTTLDTLKSGNLPFIEEGAEKILREALADKRLVFTN